MNFNIRTKRKFAFMGLFLLLYSLFPIDVLISSLMLSRTEASGEITDTFPLTYGTEANWEFYSQKQILTPQVNITSVSGKKIKSVEYSDSTGTKTVPDAVGKASWPGSVTTSGNEIDVLSEGNSRTDTYFAWYRYSINDPQKGWFAQQEDEFGVVHELYNENGPVETVNGVSMPQYPSGGPYSVVFPASRTEGFYDSTSKYIDNNFVQVTNFSVPIVIGGRLITGPNGTSAFSESEVSSNAISNPQLIQLDPNNTDQFKIKYDQLFGGFPDDTPPPSSAIQNLGVPGSRLMVYFGSFTFDIYGKTYKHPASVTVTYEDSVTTEPDLGSPGLLMDAGCKEVNTATTFTVTLKNNGNGDVTTPFTVKVKNGGSVLRSEIVSNLAAGASKTFTFSYTPTMQGTLNLDVLLDSENDLNSGTNKETNKTDNNKSFSFTIENTGGCSTSPDPGPETITGDFTIDKSTINFGQTNYFRPSNVAVTGSKNGVACTIAEVKYTATQLGTQSWSANNAFVVTFGGPPYPAGAGAGMVNVIMKITSSCGASKTVYPKSFEIIVPPGNNPPVFEPGWFRAGDVSRYPGIQTIVVNQYVDLGIIKDITRNPNTPYDFEGDGIIYTWDFEGSSSPWIRSLQTRFGYTHDEYYNNIKADVLGIHTVKVSAVDTRGAVTPIKTVTLNVIPENPIAVITPKAPAASCSQVQVKSRRPVPSDFLDGSQSYSPIGRAIVEYQWTNKQTMYINDTGAPTIEHVTLMVKDSGGLWSVQPATCDITVLPDDPPVAKGIVPPLGVRNQAVTITNTSFSPDGDPITGVSYRYKYDAANDGIGNDGWSYPAGGTMAGLAFTANRVGKYYFEITACDAFSLCDNTSNETAASYTLDIVNNAPEVSFKVEGDNNQPDFNAPREFTGKQMLDNWTLYEVNTNKVENKNFWYTNSQGKLSITTGRGPQIQKAWAWTDTRFNTTSYYGGTYYHADDGFGPNRISPWRAMQYVSYSSPILIPMVGSARLMDPSQPYTTLKVPRFTGGLKSNPKYMFVIDESNITCSDGYSVCGKNQFLYAWNKSKNPGYSYQTIYSGVNADGKHTWSSMPYDFIIGMPSNQPYSRYSYSVPLNGGPYTTPMSEIYQSTSVQVSDTYIAKIITWSHPTGLMAGTNSCWTNEYGSEECDYYSYTVNPYKVYEVTFYDPFTGAQLGTINATPYPDASANVVPLLTNQGISFDLRANSIGALNVVQSKVYNSAGTIIEDSSKPNTYNEIQPQSIVAAARSLAYGGGYTTSPATTYTCIPQYVGDVTNDAEGYSYQYLKKTCGNLNGVFNPETPAGMWLVKKDKNNQVVWQANLSGQLDTYISVDGNRNSLMSSGRYLLAIDPISRQILTQTLDQYRVPGNMYDSQFIYNDIVNMDTGAAYATGLPFGVEQKSPSVDGNNGGFGGAQCTYTIEGNCTGEPSGIGGYLDFHADTYTVNYNQTSGISFSEFLGDGFLVNMMPTYGYGQGPGWSNGFLLRGDLTMWVQSGPPTTSPVIRKAGMLGQFVSPESFGDVEITSSITLNNRDFDAGKLAGVSFRMADPQNRYAVETDGNTWYLSRYIGGSRAVMQSIPWSLAAGSAYSIRIKSVGSQFEVWINNTPVFSTSDPTFSSGKVGPFTDRAYVSFGTVGVKIVENTSFKIRGYAILEESTGKATVSYSDVTFTDPEGDPRSGTFKWAYTHNPRFLNNQGTATMSGTVASGPLEFTKVGDYTLKLSADDDPHPDYLYPSNVFGSYRKTSNPYEQLLTVHRRPYSIFDLVQNGDGTISWINDNSYDPDRYIPGSGTASTEATGIDYYATKGVVERRYWFIDPDGILTNSKLTRPQKVGTYKVAMQVKDEYGAWSIATIKEITSGLIAPANEPPVASMRIPGGSYANPTVVTTTRPYFEWNQTDSDPGAVFSQFNIQILTEAGGLLYDSGAVPQGPTSATVQGWTITSDLPAGQKLQVRVRVFDGTDWSLNWSATTWFYINRAPSAVVIVPGGSYAAPTVYDNDRYPWIQWIQSDPDVGTTFNLFEVQVLDESGSTVLSTSNQAWQGTESTTYSWQVNQALPYAQKLQVRVRVTDQFNTWSGWSASTWLIIVPPGVTPGVDTDTDFDQRMNPDSNPVIVLDRNITIRFDGTYNFERYVRFPFDVYSSDKVTFYPANTLITAATTAIFYMPTWNEEGPYSVYTAQCMSGVCRTVYFTVSVAGRMFDFRITDVGDFRYESVFRSSGSTPSGNQYFSGGRDENRNPTSVYGHDSWVLPIRPGSHPTEVGTVPRNGYTFNFTFTTIGHYWDRGDGVLIEPTFWFVPRSGGAAVAVDLYYDTSGNANKMIKVGSSRDMNIFGRRYSLADSLRNVPTAELNGAASYEYNQIFTAAERSMLTWSRFMEDYMSRLTTISAGYGMEILPYKSRTLLGPASVPSGVNAIAAQRSIQQWYGEYSLPIAPYILPKGTDILSLSTAHQFGLTGYEPEFLKDGYLIVNFGLYTLRNNDQNTKVLGYKAPRTDMWAVEGQVTSSTDWKGRTYTYRSGDVILFESDYSVRNDYVGIGQ